MHRISSVLLSRGDGTTAIYRFFSSSALLSPSPHSELLTIYLPPLVLLCPSLPPLPGVLRRQATPAHHSPGWLGKLASAVWELDDSSVSGVAMITERFFTRCFHSCSESFLFLKMEVKDRTAPLGLRAFVKNSWARLNPAWDLKLGCSVNQVFSASQVQSW